MHLEPSMGGEDFSAYLRRAPGCFIKLGTRNKNIDTCYPHHHPKFDVDESALINGVELFLETTIRLLKSYIKHKKGNCALSQLLRFLPSERAEKELCHLEHDE